MDLASELEKVGSITEQRDRVAQFKVLLSQVISRGLPAELELFFGHVLAERTPVVVSRQVLQDLSTTIFTSNLQPQQAKFIAALSLRAIQARITSFEEAFSSISEGYSELLEQEENWSEAAKVLREIPLSSGLRTLTDDYRAGKYIKIAQLYLECDDPVEAEGFVNRASAIIHKCTNPILKFTHQACRARILDSQRKFLDAARHYYELSRLDKSTVMHIEGEMDINDEDLEQQNTAALQKAVVCAILAPAGPQRSRVLAMFCKDERCPSLGVWKILEKIHTEKILRGDEVVKFTESLEEHHRAVTGGGLTVVERAFIEHNLLSAAKLYNNISLTQLGFLLNIDPAQAERIAAKMIGEQRMHAYLDQVDGILHFQAAVDTGAPSDRSIEALCIGMNTVATQIAKKYPSYVKS